MASKHSPNPPKSYCAAPWVEGIIYANGELKTCCITVTSLGNWQEDGLAAAWHSVAYQQFRKKIVEGRFPEDNCRRCYNNRYNRNLGWGLGTPFLTYLEDVQAHWTEEFPQIHALTQLFQAFPGETPKEVWQPLLLDFDAALHALSLDSRNAPQSVQLSLHKLGVIGLITRSFFEQSLTPPILAPHREVQIISRCNARCLMCLGSYTGRTAEGPSMPEEYLPEAFTRSRDIVNFFHNGSELLYYKGWKKVARLLAEAGTKISLSTNSILLTPKNIAHLVDNRLLLSVNISIDGATKETVEAIRVNVNYDKMMQGIDYLCHYSRKKNYTFPLIFSFVVMKKNYQELPQLIRLIESFKKKYPEFPFSVSLQMLALTDVSGYREFVQEQHPSAINRDELKQVFAEALAESKRTDIPVVFLNDTLETFIKNECPVPEMLDPLMFLEKGEIQHKDFSMRMGSGWHKVEIDPVPARWIDQKAIVRISVTKDKKHTLHLIMASFYRPRDCRILLNDREIFCHEIGLMPEVYSVTLELSEGENEVLIMSLDGAEAPCNIKEITSPDDRLLAFHIRGWEVL